MSTNLLRTFSCCALIAVIATGCLFTGGGGVTDDDSSTGSNNSDMNNAVANNATTSNNGASNAGENSTVGPKNVIEEESCGNGRLDLGETCDPCDDLVCPTRGCGIYARTGSDDTCDVACEATAVQTACRNDDGCCPPDCTNANDSDCSLLCGNGQRDEGEACDPCPASCPASELCAPIMTTGDATTCTLECTPLLPPDGCCGGVVCPDDTVCVAETCQAMPPLCDPIVCAAMVPGGQCNPDGTCVGSSGCNGPDDCLPWQLCMVGGTCVDPANCMAAAGRSQAWCDHQTWGSLMKFSCMLDPNSGYACVVGTTSVTCTSDADCPGIEKCEGQMCLPAENCGEARDGDLWCVYQLESLDVMCDASGMCVPL